MAFFPIFDIAATPLDLPRGKHWDTFERERLYKVVNIPGPPFDN